MGGADGRTKLGPKPRGVRQIKEDENIGAKVKQVGGLEHLLEFFRLLAGSRALWLVLRHAPVIIPNPLDGFVRLQVFLDRLELHTFLVRRTGFNPSMTDGQNVP